MEARALHAANNRIGIPGIVLTRNLNGHFNQQMTDNLLLLSIGGDQRMDDINLWPGEGYLQVEVDICHVGTICQGLEEHCLGLFVLSLCT